MATCESILPVSDDCFLHLFEWFSYRDLAAVERVCKRFRALSETTWKNHVPEKVRGSAKAWLAFRNRVMAVVPPTIVTALVSHYPDALLTPVNTLSSEGIMWKLSVVTEQPSSNCPDITGIRIGLRSATDHWQVTYGQTHWFFMHLEAMCGPPHPLHEPPRPFTEYAWQERSTIEHKKGTEDDEWTIGSKNLLNLLNAKRQLE